VRHGFNSLPDLLTSKTAIVAVAFVLLFALERAFPVAVWREGVKRVGRNLSFAALNFIASPLIVIPLTAAAASYAPDWRPTFWSGWPGLVIDLLLLDFWIYWWHRANHRLPFLWRFHEVHHLDEMLDTTSALRFHFGEVILSALVRALVIFILAVPLHSVLIFEVMLLLSTLLHHSNLKLPRGFERVLSLLIVTPSIHWVHHHAVRADTDSNYATVLSLWDRLFASTSETVRSETMKIGVEGQQEKNVLALLIKPFWH
jgi:sterol desaturase/sphingolipid hydroxylase (fatty acid hydroxylase superfamily)